jgi:hypothetical protein
VLSPIRLLATGSAAAALLLPTVASCGGPGPDRARPIAGLPEEAPRPAGLCGGAATTAVISARRDTALRARIVAAWPLDGVRAGSGLVWRGAKLLAVQDDVPRAALFDPTARVVDFVVLEGDGGPLAKALKPDFEAAVADAGVVFVLGSGSTPKRRRIARLAADGTVTVLDAGPMYDGVAAWLGSDPNIEGAIVADRALRLFHRGVGAAPSAVIDLDVEVLDGGGARVRGGCRYDLGRIGSVPLSFTDAAHFEGGRVVFLAVAEATKNAIDDGRLLGSAVGVLSGSEARWIELLEPDGTPSVRKPEGIALDPVVRGAPATGWLVTDPDDPALPAHLCRLELSGAW